MHLGWLLCARRQRLHRGARKGGHELPASHSITSSAWASSVAGTVRPSAFASPLSRGRAVGDGCLLADGGGAEPVERAHFNGDERAIVIWQDESPSS
jgi:hypothetical protein